MENIDESPKKGFGRVVQFGLLLFILIVSPALSWYYLRSGVDYRKNSLSELKDLGAMDFYDWKLVPAKAIQADSIKGKLTIVNVFDPQTPQGAQHSAVMRKLFDQFKDRRDVLLVSFLMNTDSSATVAYAKQQNPKSYRNYRFATTTGNNYTELLKGLKLSQKGDFSASECPYFTYIDMKGDVKSFYDVRDNQQLGRLVEHIAMKLTIDPFDQPEIKREKEK